MYKKINIKDMLIYKITREIYYWVLRPFAELAQRIRKVAKDHFCEKKLGINTVNNSPVEDDVTVFKDSSQYIPTPYNIIEKMLEYLHFGPDDIFVDLGCGKGRVVFSVAMKKLKKVIGIEARKDMFEITMQNLKNLKLKNTPVEIFNADVTNFDMKEGTVFFMFSPFGRNTLMKVLENIKNSLTDNPRKIRVVCYGGPDIYGIDGCDNWIEHEKKLFDINVDIWHSKI